MLMVENSKQRIRAILDEIERLKQSEFPYTHPKLALNYIEERFQSELTRLAKLELSGSKHIDSYHCQLSLVLISQYDPILGFILRSTNVRNAFEVYYPLLHLAQDILGNNVKLILSSEWWFSPYTYQSRDYLPDFILVGLPAPESSNPLLIPLAGHELGHSVWKLEGLADNFDKKIKDRIINELVNNKWSDYCAIYPNFTKEDLRGSNIFAPSTWEPALNWARQQIEEIFCDFFGMRIFAESYLHAFSYLISPGTSGPRIECYPDIKARASYLIAAAKSMGVSVLPEFEISFEPDKEPDERQAKLLVSIADVVSGSFVDDLLQLVNNLAIQKPIPSRDPTKVITISNAFRKCIAPTRYKENLTDILNAGWDCILDPKLWGKVTHIKHDDRVRILQDIMLKSMEVSEVYMRLSK